MLPDNCKGTCGIPAKINDSVFSYIHNSPLSRDWFFDPKYPNVHAAVCSSCYGPYVKVPYTMLMEYMREPELYGQDLKVFLKDYSDMRAYISPPLGLPGIEDVIFHPPATIVKWKDGTKTVVKVQDDDIYDPYNGLAICIAKKALGDKGNFNNVINHWVDKKCPEYAKLYSFASSFKAGLTAPFEASKGTFDKVFGLGDGFRKTCENRLTAGQEDEEVEKEIENGHWTFEINCSDGNLRMLGHPNGTISGVYLDDDLETK